MKILVVEDKPIHQQSAHMTLAGHELTIIASFTEAMKALQQPFSYEAVLTDMMMPMCPETLAREVFKPGEQVPYGFVIALRASFCGAKYVAMVTDTNHHQGAMSAALDHLGRAYYDKGFKPNFVINGAKCMFVHAPFLKIEAKEQGKCPRCRGSGKCPACTGAGDRYNLVEQGTCSHCGGTGTCGECKGSGIYEYTREVNAKDWGQVLKDLTVQVEIPCG